MRQAEAKSCVEGHCASACLKMPSRYRVSLLNPNNAGKVLDLPEFRIAGHDDGLVLQRRGKGEAVGEGDAVLGLEFRGLEDQVVRHRKDGEAHALDVRKDFYLLLVAEVSFYRIDDFSQVDGAEEGRRFGAAGVAQEACHLFVARVFLGKIEERVGVEGGGGVGGYL